MYFDTMKYIFEVLPNMNKVPDANNNYSLHIIITYYYQYNNSYDVIKLIYESYPEALRKYNSKGKLPIDNINLRNKSNSNIIQIMRIIELLTKDFPESLLGGVGIIIMHHYYKLYYY